MDGLSVLIGFLAGFVVFGLMLTFTGSAKAEHYYKENVCKFVEGTWHDGDELCIRDRVVVDMPQEEK